MSTHVYNSMTTPNNLPLCLSSLVIPFSETFLSLEMNRKLASHAKRQTTNTKEIHHWLNLDIQGFGLLWTYFATIFQSWTIMSLSRITIQISPHTLHATPWWVDCWLGAVNRIIKSSQPMLQYSNLLIEWSRVVWDTDLIVEMRRKFR